MPDAAGAFWATPGLVWLFLTISVAGIVRGFTGFGTALVFVPVAGIFLPPQTVIALMTLTGLGSTATLLPRAWGQAARREVALLSLAAIVTVPLGLALMGGLDRDVVRWIVAAVAAITLVSLIGGWRYSRKVGRKGVLAVGGVAGIVGGLTGLTGPAVILFYLAGQVTAQSVRANTILFLAVLDVVIFVNLMLQQAVGWYVVVLAASLGVPYLFATLLGQALFDPRHERLYRWAAYGVIGLALVTGLPVWD